MHFIFCFFAFVCSSHCRLFCFVCFKRQINKHHRLFYLFCLGFRTRFFNLYSFICSPPCLCIYMHASPYFCSFACSLIYIFRLIFNFVCTSFRVLLSLSPNKAPTHSAAAAAAVLRFSATAAVLLSAAAAAAALRCAAAAAAS